MPELTGEAISVWCFYRQMIDANTKSYEQHASAGRNGGVASGVTRGRSRTAARSAIAKSVRPSETAAPEAASIPEPCFSGTGSPRADSSRRGSPAPQYHQRPVSGEINTADAVVEEWRRKHPENHGC